VKVSEDELYGRIIRLALDGFFDELTGGSFFAEAIERRDSRSVAFQGLIAVRATFLQEEVAGT
jgi:hypothetical protein